MQLVEIICNMWASLCNHNWEKQKNVISNNQLYWERHKGPLSLTWTNFIPEWISNHVSSKVWDEISNPFPHWNGATVNVWQWINNFSSYFITDLLLIHAGTMWVFAFAFIVICRLIHIALHYITGTEAILRLWSNHKNMGKWTARYIYIYIW